MSRFVHTPQYTPKNIDEPLLYSHLSYNYYIISRQKASQNILSSAFRKAPQSTGLFQLLTISHLFGLRL